MTVPNAEKIACWKYDDIYSFYDHNEGDTQDLLDGSYFACETLDEGFVGYFCFGKEARIPTLEGYVYDEAFLDFGIGLKPELCGKGLGAHFALQALMYAKKLYKVSDFRLSVAAFNERAIKVYRRIGFYTECEVTNAYYKNKFYIMKLKMNR